jgi:excinuclease ABC subunit A
VATTTEVWHFLRLLWVKLGMQHCVNDGAPVKPQSAESIAAQLLRDHRGQHVGLLAPLVVNRKGVYTDLAKWAKARGHTHLRVDGEFLRVDPFPRIDRFKEHTIELPVGAWWSAPGRTRPSCAPAEQGAGPGQGRAAPAAPAGRAGRRDGQPAAQRWHRRAEGVFHQARLPACGTSYPELDPRLFSYNSKHGWCTGCVGTGLKLTREQRKAYDDSRARRRQQGPRAELPAEEPEVEGLADEPCTECGGARLNAVARGVTFEGKAIGSGGALSVARRGSGWMQRWRWQGRDADIARDVVVEIKSRLSSWRGGPGLPDAGPRRAHAQRRRGAAHPPGRAAGQQPAGRVLRAGRAHHRPAPARQPRAAGRAGQAGRKGNTLVVVEHDEDTIRRADHLIDIGPGAGKRGGTLVAQGTVADLSAQPDSVTGRFLAHPLKHPLQARRAVDAAQPRCTCARRGAAQPAAAGRGRAAAAAGGGDGRVRLGQEHAGARRAAGQRGRRWWA